MHFSRVSTKFKEFETHYSSKDCTNLVVLSLNGAYLLSYGSKSSIIQVWNTETGKLTCKFKEH